MKSGSALILLITLICSVLSPLTVQISSAPNSNVTYLVTLDVCHASSSPGSINTEMPFYCEDSMELAGLEETLRYHLSSQVSVPVRISSLDERPPEA